MRTGRYVLECVLADRNDITEDSLEQLWTEYSSDETLPDSQLTPDQLFFRRHYHQWTRFLSRKSPVPSFGQWGRDLLRVTMTHQVRLRERRKRALHNSTADQGSVRYQDMTRTLHDFHQVILRARRGSIGDFVWCSWVALCRSPG